MTRKRHPKFARLERNNPEIERRRLHGSCRCFGRMSSESTGEGSNTEHHGNRPSAEAALALANILPTQSFNPGRFFCVISQTAARSTPM